MGHDVDDRAARLAEHEASDSPLLVAERVDDFEARQGAAGFWAPKWTPSAQPCPYAWTGTWRTLRLAGALREYGEARNRTGDTTIFSRSRERPDIRHNACIITISSYALKAGTTAGLGGIPEGSGLDTASESNLCGEARCRGFQGSGGPVKDLEDVVCEERRRGGCHVGSPPSSSARRTMVGPRGSASANSSLRWPTARRSRPGEFVVGRLRRSGRSACVSAWALAAVHVTRTGGRGPRPGQLRSASQTITAGRPVSACSKASWRSALARDRAPSRSMRGSIRRLGTRPAAANASR